MIAINHGATYRPAGPLLRVLRLDRWECSTCQRDNLMRRGTSVLHRPCRWCGAEMLSWPAVGRSIGQQIADGFVAIGEAARRAVEAFAGFAHEFNPGPTITSRQEDR